MSVEIPWRAAVRSQSEAALAMLENAIRTCPETLWSGGGRAPEFWYLAYHTLFFLDYYSGGSERGFAPPAPFTLSELDPSGAMPGRTYTKEELLGYLAHGRGRLRQALDGLTDAGAAQPCGFHRFDMSAGEMLIYSLRHVQHHAAQLQLLLRQATGAAPAWVSRGAGARHGGGPPGGGGT